MPGNSFEGIVAIGREREKERKEERERGREAEAWRHPLLLKQAMMGIAGSWRHLTERKQSIID